MLERLEGLSRGRLGATAFAIALVVYLPTATYSASHVNDVRAATIAAWSIGSHGTVAVPMAPLDGIPWVRQVDGQIRVHRTPGPILWASPFYVLDDTPAATIEDVRDVPFGPATLSAVLATSIGIGLMAAACRLIAPPLVALSSALLLALGTGNWSVSADGAWTHGLTLMFLAAGLLAMGQRRHAVGGLAMAGAILARPQTAVAPMVMGLWSGLKARSLRPVMAVASTSLLGVAGVVAWYRPLFGEWIPRAGFVSSIATGAAPSGGKGVLAGLVDWAGSLALWLVSPSRGLLVFSPFLLLLVPHLRNAWRGAPDWVRSSAMAGLVYVVVQSRGNVWHGGGNYFGYRLPLELLTLAWPLLTLAYLRGVHESSRRRPIFLVLAAASILVFLLGELFLRPDPLDLIRATLTG